MLPFVPRLAPLGRIHRRDWLALGLGALAAPAFAKPTGKPRAKRVLVVFTPGGVSQLETFDPKPNAPEEVRGAFGTIPTAVPGLRFGEHLPKLAKLADQFAVVRSVSHDDLDHGSACYLSLTGQFHSRKSSNPPLSPADYPTLGAIVQRLRPSDQFPRSAVYLNGPVLLPEIPGPGNNGGFLGRGCDPLTVADPGAAKELVAGLSLPGEVSPPRLDSRRELLASLDRTATESTYRENTQAAFKLLHTKSVREAFDLSRESEQTRDAYGRHRSGQSCLLARRLLEAGVPWVTAFFNHTIRGQDKSEETNEYGWDTHNDIFAALKDHLLPRFDQTFTALLTDLHDRGLLKDTLVCCMGEFGRAPKVALEKNFAGTSPGRKHWGGCYSVLFAGAGVSGGAVIGSSDQQAAYPQADPLTPGDVVATLFDALGIDPAGHYTDPAERPYRVATGEAIAGLFR
ncbi:MAG: DUF1501 domain-containing protein [Fimbriiglobus sp.]|nr:DUF1501 domain-containing protein [Fimbriiglobus sp.]